MTNLRIRKKDCIDCGEKISRDANRCPHCTSYQDGSSGFNARTGQLIMLFAVLVSAYAAYQASEASRLATIGHLSPTLTRLELRNESLDFEIFNTGNLRAHLKGLSVSAKGYLDTPRGDSGDKREVRTDIQFDFGDDDKQIQPRDRLTSNLPLRSVTSVSIDAAYRSMDSNEVLATFASTSGEGPSTCTASMSFIDPHGAVNSRLIASPTIDCKIVADLIVRIRARNVANRGPQH